MATFIRLVDYKSSEKKEEEFFNPDNKYVVKMQDDFSGIPGSPIAYWISKKMRDILSNNSINLNSISPPRAGLTSGKNECFLRYWMEVSKNKISGLGQNFGTARKWYFLTKGGGFRKWYGNNDYVLNWENNGEAIKKMDNSVIRNEKFYFQEGISWGDVGSEYPSFRYQCKGYISNSRGPMIYCGNFLILALFNTKLVVHILKVFSPTLVFNIGEIASVPILFPKVENTEHEIKYLTQSCIDISREEWDSRETSWDFITNELLRHKTTNLIEDAYNIYCAYWKDQFFKLHSNEEELNRIFINIYNLADELTPDVSLDDITILKTESEIKDGELVFKKDIIIKQFISYAVGCMFGRYSPDKPGLILANQGETINDFREKVPDASFMPDEDNIIPILDDDYFTDDIVGRFKEFLKITFGAETLSENLDFIAGALSKSKKSDASPEKVIRDYFLKDFFKDHVRMYKKRPIYWLFTSGKGRGFNALVYMHRYNRETLAKMRTDYLLELEAKLDARIGMLGDGAGVEKGRLGKQVAELVAYDEKLNHKSLQMIEIDLDDGVAVNYGKFEGLVGEI